MYAVFFNQFSTNGLKLYRFFLFFLVFGRLEAEKGDSLKLDEQINAGFAKLNAGELKEAERLFKGLQVHDNPHIQDFGHLGMAKLAIREKRFADAKTLLDSLKKENLVPLELKQEWILAESDLALNQGEYETCFNWLKKADSQSPKTVLSNAKAHVNQAESTPYFSARLKSLNEAKTCLNALDCNENSIDSAIQICQAEALIQEGSVASLELADKILEQITEDYPENPLLKSQILAKKGDFGAAINLLEIQNLNRPLDQKKLFLIGTYLYQDKKYQEALLAFQNLPIQYPESSLVPDALYWIARAKEASGEPVKIYRQDYQNFYQTYPNHALAAEAYLNCYTPQEYLIGDRQALKHLQAFPSKFPKSPLVLYASYYIGLDCLHDRRSFEGKWISRQDLMGAIDAFQHVETSFNELQNSQDISHLIPIRNQAILERAKTNLKIAERSKPAKKVIYLDYAEDVFSNLLSNLSEESDPLYAETLYFLALTKIQSGKSSQALENLERLIQLYQDHSSHNPYFLAQAFYQKGLLENGPSSLELFEKALQTGKPNYLSNDEILNIMIAKAEIFRKEGRLDDAMLQLSEVVNYSTASSLRLKAMFLRAEIYTEQGRMALAQKQLESIALKGGDWAIKAKEQLDKYHGFE